MQTTVFRSVSEFMGAAQSSLEEQEFRSSLIYGISLSIRDRGRYSDCGPVFTYSQSSEGSWVAGMITPPHRLALSYGGDAPDQELLVVDLANTLKQAGIEFPGVTAPMTLAEQFNRIWGGLAGVTAELAFDQGFYALDEVVLEPVAGGKLRQAESQDVEVLVQWATEFQQEALGEDLSDQAAKKDIEQRLADSALFVWEEQSQLKSMLASSRPTKHTITINYVFTPVDLRGRGYATSAVSALSEKLLGDGYRYVVLFTDMANPTSNSIYKKVGFRQVERFGTFNFKSAA